MEITAKIIITLIVLFIAAKSIHWTWTSQIDPIATFQKIIGKKPKLADVVATRDSNKLYQDGNTVADVTGPVEINNGKIILKQIANTSALNIENPIEYRRMTLKVVRVGRIIGTKAVVSNSRSMVLQNVMEDVACEVIK